MKTVLYAALALASIAGTAARADDGDDFKFNLVNKSHVQAIQFYTMNQNGKWSGDWLSTPLAPGATRPMHFNANSQDDRCEVRTRVVFSDQSEFDTPVTYCKTTNVVVTDKELFTQ